MNLCKSFMILAMVTLNPANAQAQSPAAVDPENSVRAEIKVKADAESAAISAFEKIHCGRGGVLAGVHRTRAHPEPDFSRAFCRCKGADYPLDADNSPCHPTAPPKTYESHAIEEKLEPQTHMTLSRPELGPAVEPCCSAQANAEPGPKKSTLTVLKEKIEPEAKVRDPSPAVPIALHLKSLAPPKPVRKLTSPPVLVSKLPIAQRVFDSDALAKMRKEVKATGDCMSMGVTLDAKFKEQLAKRYHALDVSNQLKTQSYPTTDLESSYRGIHDAPVSYKAPQELSVADLKKPGIYCGFDFLRDAVQNGFVVHAMSETEITEAGSDGRRDDCTKLKRLTNGFWRVQSSCTNLQSYDSYTLYAMDIRFVKLIPGVYLAMTYSKRLEQDSVPQLDKAFGMALVFSDVVPAKKRP